MPSMPSTFTSPEKRNTEFPDDDFLPLEMGDDDLIYLPKNALQRAPSLLKEAFVNEEGSTRGIVKLDDIDKWLEGKATSKEAVDVVFGCLLYGFIDVVEVRSAAVYGCRSRWD